MLKSVLSPIPSHAMTCFKLPKSLTKRIQSAVTRFLWDDRTGKKKMAWIGWDKLAQPKGKGGLGLRDFESFNDAFLGKLSWRIINNPHGLLSRVLLGKYCMEGKFMDFPDRASESHGWRSILVGRDLIKKNPGWLVGDGTQIDLWSDPWLNVSQQEQLMGPPTETTLNYKVSALLTQDSSDWDIEKIREICPFAEKQILKIKTSRSGAPDKLCWMGTKDGEYSTKSGYHAAFEEANDAERLEMSGNWNQEVWNLSTAPKIKMLVWKVLRGALPVGQG